MGSEADVCLLVGADAEADALPTVLLVPGWACSWDGGGALYGSSVVDDMPPGLVGNCIPPLPCAKVS
jgi:hypothetical protein